MNLLMTIINSSTNLFLYIFNNFCSFCALNIFLKLLYLFLYKSLLSPLKGPLTEMTFLW